MIDAKLCKLCKGRGDKPFPQLFDGPKECQRCGRKIKKPKKREAKTK